MQAPLQSGAVSPCIDHGGASSGPLTVRHEPTGKPICPNLSVYPRTFFSQVYVSKCSLRTQSIVLDEQELLQHLRTACRLAWLPFWRFEAIYFGRSLG